MSPPDNTGALEAGTSGLYMVLSACMRSIHRHEQDPDSYLSWARESIPVLMPELSQADDEDAAKMAFWLARAIWDVTPLFGNRYRPRPLPAPERNGLCPCGSGLKFKRCCRLAPKPPDLPAEAMWSVMVESYSAKHWVEEARAGDLPVAGVLAAGHHFMEEQRWRALKDLGDAVLGEGVAIKDASLAWLIDPVCDAYNNLYKTDKKKLELLNRLADHPLGPVSAGANQRLASWHHDHEHPEAAWAAVQRAQRAAPDDPANAALEASLLVADGLYERAQERAGFWLRRLHKIPDVPEEVLTFLSAVHEDPRGAFAGVGRDMAPAPIGALFDWIDEHVDRPLPELHWRAVGSPDAEEKWLQDAFEPEPSAEEAELIREWGLLSGLSKPFSVQWFSGDEPEAWSRCEDWLPWLDARPEVLDSLSILDDLIALLATADEVYEQIENVWIEKLIDRGVRIVLQHWPVGAKGTLPWLITENRPALRILAQAINYSGDGWNERTWLIASTCLRLNPGDNHGFRAPVINQLLIAGRDEEALALAEQYADDAMAEIVYGRVLALYRCGRGGEAVNALQVAAREQPLILDFLARDRVAQPRIDPFSVTIGGKDQAWLYREAMRTEWLATEGMKDWLMPLARKIKAQRRR